MDWVQIHFMLETLFVPVILLISLAIWLIAKGVEWKNERRKTNSRTTKNQR